MYAVTRNLRSSIEGENLFLHKECFFLGAASSASTAPSFRYRGVRQCIWGSGEPAGRLGPFGPSAGCDHRYLAGTKSCTLVSGAAQNNLPRMGPCSEQATNSEPAAPRRRCKPRMKMRHRKPKWRSLTAQRISKRRGQEWRGLSVLPLKKTRDVCHSRLRTFHQEPKRATLASEAHRTSRENVPLCINIGADCE